MIVMKINKKYPYKWMVHRNDNVNLQEIIIKNYKNFNKFISFINFYLFGDVSLMFADLLIIF